MAEWKDCAYCGTEFRARGHAQKYCTADCRRMAEREQSNEARRKATESERAVNEVLKFAEAYKRENGVYLSYGRAAALMDKRKAGKA